MGRQTAIISPPEKLPASLDNPRLAAYIGW